MQETWVRFLGWEDFPGEGNGNPLQHSCLENPMNRGAWWATVHGITKNQTWLSPQLPPATAAETGTETVSKFSISFASYNLLISLSIHTLWLFFLFFHFLLADFLISSRYQRHYVNLNSVSTMPVLWNLQYTEFLQLPSPL